MNKKQNLTTDSITLFISKDELLEYSEEISERASEPFKISMKYYFITRYLVVVYESRYGKLPIQVWNEYRNAFDHFFRHESSVSGISSHLKNMESHILRAALDALKIICHEMIEELKLTVSKHDPAVLALVDNGAFSGEVSTATKLGRKLFELAKVNDSTLGAASTSNMDVLNRYLDAFFSLEAAAKMFDQKENDINIAYQTHKGIASAASNHSTVHHLCVHTLFYILKAFALILIGFFINEFWEPTISPILFGEEVSPAIVQPDDTENL